MSMYSITPQCADDKIRNRIDLHSTSPFALSRDKVLLAELETAIRWYENLDPIGRRFTEEGKRFGEIYASPRISNPPENKYYDRSAVTAVAIFYQKNTCLFQIKQLFDASSLDCDERVAEDEPLMGELTLEDAIYYAHQKYLMLYFNQCRQSLQRERDRLMKIDEELDLLTHQAARLLTDDGDLSL